MKGRTTGRSHPPPPSEPEENLTGFVPLERRSRGAPAGNSNAKDAAAFKTKTVEQLQRMRKSGLTAGRIEEISRGSVTVDDVLNILARKRVPIEIYRALAKALEKAEKGE